jgi:hypothetical protein
MRLILVKSAELISILGSSYEGVLSSDDYSAYNGYAVKARAEMPSASTSSLQETHSASRLT